MKFALLPESFHPSVKLRAIQASDLEAWYSYLCIPSVIEHTSWNLQSPADLAGYLSGAEPVTESSRLRLAIVLRESNAPVGTVGFNTVSAENRSAEIAYDLSPSVWHQGIATYAWKLMVAWAQEHVGVVHVQATVLESNIRSQAVLTRCNFEREGLLRSYRMVRGKTGNFFMYYNVVHSQQPAA